VGSGVAWAAVDQAHHTVYVAKFNDGTVSVINGVRCNAHVTSGCGSTWPTVTTGANPAYVAVDPSSGTAFVVNHVDDTLSAINTSTCNGTTTSGCGGRARNEQATPEQDPGFNSFPGAVTLDPQTGSAYVLNVGGPNVMSVVSISHCNATDTTGCRAEAPSVPAHEATISADPATGTIYASNTSRPQIDVLNAATCHAGNLTGCTPVAEIPVGHPMANLSGVDAVTHTLYAADPAAGTVAAINTAACNAATTTGCAQHPPVIKVGASPNTPVINPVTRTLYVSYGHNADRSPWSAPRPATPPAPPAAGRLRPWSRSGPGPPSWRSALDRHHLRPQLRDVVQRAHDVGDQRRDLQRHQPLRLLAAGRDRDGRGRPVRRRRERPHAHRLRRQQRLR
jgi:DNA-binding beta-propeller fold protein YncE